MIINVNVEAGTWQGLSHSWSGTFFRFQVEQRRQDRH